MLEDPPVDKKHHQIVTKAGDVLQVRKGAELIHGPEDLSGHRKHPHHANGHDGQKGPFIPAEQEIKPKEHQHSHTDEQAGGEGQVDLFPGPVVQVFHQHDKKTIADVQERVDEEEQPEKLFQLVRHFLHCITPKISQACICTQFIVF